jgi:hypothetical protein
VQSPLGLSKAPSLTRRAGQQLKQVLATETLSVDGVLAGCGPPPDPPELLTGRTVRIRSDAIGVASGKLRAVSSASIDRAEDEARIVLAPAWLTIGWSHRGARNVIAPMAARREDLGEYIVLQPSTCWSWPVSAWSADRAPSYRAGIVAEWSEPHEPIRRAIFALIG